MSLTLADSAALPRKVNTQQAEAPVPLPAGAAHIIRDDAEAIAVAHQLAASFAREAALRDREGILPLKELDAFSQSGLWAMAIPKAWGGAGVSWTTVARVIAIISAADPALGQLPQNHLAGVAHLLEDGSEAQKQVLLSEVLAGLRWGNAFSEKHGRTVADFQTRFRRDGDEVVINGEKFYATGALLAHRIHAVALDEQDRAHLIVLDRDTPGISVINNWSAFGQRTTASGTVLLENVRAPLSRVIPTWQAFERPTAAGPISQIIQAAVDVGIARGTIEDTLQFVRERSRPWIDSGQARAADDHFTLAAVGDLKIRLHAAEALLWQAGAAIDAALTQPDETSVARATVATAEAKVLTTEIALLAGNKLFELAGTRATLQEFNLDRHWRNARTHTLHDPVRWKYYHVGNYYLNGTPPPRHAWS
ncbi:SfnB family sulfur acquisition oxidoreductase [Pantoea dispersa]|uniref:SfnB family sulfur acquisition oxidoreductase n=2 Tax=Pantoea TaxID=53335 RepID=UPI000737945A|nr:SfnB family sulfur acquisition oxidoreductase [Pantoea dispersa]KAF0853931.1 acyl-CoA dehydrogenase [Pantoea dispersa 625]KTR99115.1 monooxygenase [Pantoea dispersa]MCI1026741.1 SfnB family sulfur acquisition oxidoreductase [Pantoea dispersa]MCT6592268.1 SfnB family sulfur acquisition oxidoreductase [Pantoea dispersa]RVU74929.1 SfnB family sulfur acquisition oxidoreductase [Pantoea dispersa]